MHDVAGHRAVRGTRAWLVASTVAAAILGLQGDAEAGLQLLYATSVSGARIATVDTVTGAVNTVVNTPSGVDALVFDPSGRIVYTEPGATTGNVRIFDPATQTDSPLATVKSPLDIALDPSGLSVLVDDFTGGTSNIDRIVLATGMVTPSPRI